MVSFYMQHNLTVCWGHEGSTGTDVSVQALIEKWPIAFIPKVTSANVSHHDQEWSFTLSCSGPTLAVGFTIQSISQPATEPLEAFSSSSSFSCLKCGKLNCLGKISHAVSAGRGHQWEKETGRSPTLFWCLVFSGLWKHQITQHALKVSQSWECWSGSVTVLLLLSYHDPSQQAPEEREWKSHCQSDSFQYRHWRPLPQCQHHQTALKNK